MTSSKVVGPLGTYVLRLIMLEALRCYQIDNKIGMHWLEKVAEHLWIKWGVEQ